MSTFDTPDDIRDRTAFNDALNSLLRAAEAHDVDIEGGYECDGEEEYIYGIEIYRVAGRSD